MKNILHLFILLFCTFLAFPPLGSAQRISMDDPIYKVHKIYPPISITKENLKKANTLIELNERYKSSWVRTYLSVELSAIYKGAIKKVVGPDHRLTQEQKELLYQADKGTTISVLVKYIPENNLKQNDPKEMDFKLAVDPDRDAHYAEGAQQLKQYLRERAIDQLPNDEPLEFTAVKFIVGKDGEIGNVHVFNSSGNEQVDALLLETISRMPCWQAAEYADGTKIEQEFVLTLGDLQKSCVSNLLNIRRNKPVMGD